MKQIKRSVSLTVLLVILMLCLTGCGATKESLMIGAGRRILSAKSYTMKTVMDVEMTGSVLGTEVGASIVVDMDTDINAKPFVGHSKGNMKIEMFGQEQKVDMELYEEINDDEITVYMTTAGFEWSKQTKPAEGQDISALEGLLGLLQVVDKFELEKDTTMLDGEACYLIKGEIDGEMLEQIFDSALGTADDTKKLFEGANWNGRQVPAAIYITKKGVQPRKLSFDMIGIMDETMESSLGEFSGLLKFEKCVADIYFNDFNKIEKIEIPDDVKANAKDGTPS